MSTGPRTPHLSEALKKSDDSLIHSHNRCVEQYREHLSSPSQWTSYLCIQVEQSSWITVLHQTWRSSGRSVSLGNIKQRDSAECLHPSSRMSAKCRDRSDPNSWDKSGRENGFLRTSVSRSGRLTRNAKGSHVKITEELVR